MNNKTSGRNKNELVQSAILFKRYAFKNKGKKVKIVGDHSRKDQTAEILRYQEVEGEPAIRLKDALNEFFVFRLSNLQLIN